MADVTIGNGSGTYILAGSQGGTITVGNGHDTVSVSGGQDQTIKVGNGQDILTVTGAQGDTIIAGNGGDRLTVSGGSDNTISLGNGNATLTVTGESNDTITVGNGTDKVTISGGSGNAITAGNGNITVVASGDSNDIIALGNGNDTVYLGANDTLTMGKGSDLAVLPTGGLSLAAPSSLSVLEDHAIGLGISASLAGLGFGQERIFGFAAADQLQFTTSQFANFAAVMAAATQVGQNTVITASPTDSIILENVQRSSLSAKNFAFVAGASSGPATLTITGVPADAVLSSAADPSGVSFNASTGTWTVAAAALPDLTLDAGEVTNATLTVTATDSNGKSITQNIALTVNPAAPTLTAPSSLTVDAGTTVALSITETPFDPRDTVAITISGVPLDASLSAGTSDGHGSWTLTPAQLAGLSLTTGQAAVTTLTVTATNTQGQTASSTDQVSLTVLPVVNLSLSVVGNLPVQEGQTLVASATIGGDNADAGVPIAYQWQKSTDGGVTWTNVSATAGGKFSNGVPSSFYQMTEADEGAQFRVQASFTDHFGQVITATSQPMANVADVTPVITASFQYAVDNLSIVKNGTQIYNNDFAVAPPNSPTILGPGGVPTDIAFLTLGSTWSDVGGKAIMSSTGLAPDPALGGTFEDYAVLNTNTDPTSTTGLKLGADFAVSSTFDLTAPNRSGYGMELNDGTATHGVDQLVRLIVQSTPAGPMVELVQRDLTQNPAPNIILASQALSAADFANNDQIEFQLSHVANSTAISGSFELLNHGNVTATVNFGPTATIFTNGVDWTRVDVGAFTNAGVGLNVGPGQAPREGQTLIANASTNDADAVLSYQWQSSADGGQTWNNIAGANGTTYMAEESDEGSELRVLATTSDPDNGQTASATSVATGAVRDQLPTVTTPVITGMAQEGQTLSASANAGEGDDAVTYQWFSSADNYTTAISTGATYVVQEGDENHQIEVVATATNDNGETASQTSVATASVIDNSSISLAVSVLGNAVVQEGQTLVASATITGDSDDVTAPVTYQWQSSSDGGTTWQNVAATTSGTFNGVLSSLYQLGEGDEGKIFRATASFTDDTGQVVSATSASTAAVTDITPIVTVPFSYAMDEFKVVKAAATFDDTFTQGPPPVGGLFGTTPVLFNTANGSIWTEANGKAILSSTGAVPNATLSNNDSVGATLLTNTQPEGTGSGQSEMGLKEDQTFTVSGTFDLAVPPPGANVYGIELLNGGVNGAPNNEVVQITVGRTANGSAVVNLTQANLANGTFAPIASQVLTAQQLAGNTQIEVDLAHNTPNSTAITGSFELFDNGTETAATTFGPTGHAFNNQTFTRASIFASAQTIITISGTAQEGQTLTANASTNDADATLHYQWQSSSDGSTWAPIAGAADSATYLVQESDENQFIRVTAFTTDPDNNQSASATSAATTKVIDNSSLSLSVSVLGNSAVQEGQTLLASATITGDSDDLTAPISYQWQSSADGGSTWQNVNATTSGNVNGVLSSLYQLAEGDEGKIFRATASFTDDTGQLVSATSTSTAPVVDIVPMVTVPFSFAMDEFKVVKAAGTFDDTFTQGPPPVGGTFGSNQVVFSTGNGTVWTEANGKAILSSTGAVPNSTLSNTETVSATLLTNTQPEGTGSGQSEMGLKEDQTFTVSGTYDLTLPPPGANGYGIELINGGFNGQPNNEVVQLTVNRTPNGSAVVNLTQANLANGTFSPIASQVLTAQQLAGNTQIELDLAHNTPNSTAITGSFELFDNGTETSATTFGATGHAFNNQTYTRAVAFASSQNTVTVSGTAREGQTLTANASTNDADATLHYQWQSSSDGNTWTPIAGAADSANYLVQESDENQFIRVTAFTTDPDNNQSASATSAATSKVLDNSAITLSVSVEGNLPIQEGQTVVASATISGDTDDLTAPVTYQWQWSADGGTTWTNVPETTAANFNNVASSLYQFGEADEGKIFRVTASFTDDTGQLVSATSAPTAPVADVAPVITVPFSYAVDNLSIIKNGTQIYDNNFAVAPPASSPALSNGVPTGISFVTLGSTWIAGGNEAVMASTGLAPNNAIPGSFEDYAMLTTNTDPTNTIQGLKLNASFTVSSVLGLTTPPTGSYGMELNDGTPTHGIDQLVRMIVTRDSGNTVVEMVQRDLTQNPQSNNILAEQIITTAQLSANNEIEFELSHNANSTAITGAFALGNNGAFGPLTTFAPTATIFTNGVNWTRADVGAFTGPGVGLNIAPGQSPQAGQTLTASASTNDADATLHYQWQSSADSGATWIPIGGAADSASYVVQQSDAGNEIRVEAYTTDPDNGQSATAFSGATGAVIVAAGAYTFATIDAPWGTGTFADGINNAGQVVGQAAGNPSTGFLYSGGVFTSLSVPGRGNSSAGGINNFDVINGYSEPPGASTPRYGFTYSNGSYSAPFDLPGGPGISTTEYALNDAGAFVGDSYLYGGTFYSGYVDNGGAITILQGPGATGSGGDTSAHGINNLEQVVGSYQTNVYDSSNIRHAFLYQNATYTTFDDPNGVKGTSAMGINTAGQIVGWYYDASGIQNGFLYSGGNFTTINDPLGAKGTVLTGINDSGELVGYYTDAAGKNHGFTAMDPPADPAVIAAGGTLELGAGNQPVAFADATGLLKLDQSANFNGTISGFGGADQIDLSDIAFTGATTIGYSGAANGGILSVNDGAHVANLALLGNYMATSFVTAGDGSGGTLISEAAAQAPQQQLSHPAA